MPASNRTRIINVEVPDEVGPRMRELTMKQRAFVHALVVCGGDGAAAAKAAGYGDKSETRELAESAQRQAASQLLRNDKVLEAIAEEAKKRLRSHAMVAAEKLVSLLNDPRLSAKDQYRAAVEILDRSGLVVQQQVEITHKTEKEEAVVREIELLAKEAGLDPKRLLGYTPDQPQPAEPVVEAEFTEIPDELRDLI